MRAIGQLNRATDGWTGLLLRLTLSLAVSTQILSGAAGPVDGGIPEIHSKFQVNGASTYVLKSTGDGGGAGVPVALVRVGAGENHETLVWKATVDRNSIPHWSIVQAVENEDDWAVLVREDISRKYGHLNEYGLEGFDYEYTYYLGSNAPLEACAREGLQPMPRLLRDPGRPAVLVSWRIPTRNGKLIGDKLRDLRGQLRGEEALREALKWPWHIELESPKVISCRSIDGQGGPARRWEHRIASYIENGHEVQREWSVHSPGYRAGNVEDFVTQISRGVAEPEKLPNFWRIEETIAEIGEMREVEAWLRSATGDEARAREHMATIAKGLEVGARLRAEQLVKDEAFRKEALAREEARKQASEKYLEERRQLSLKMHQEYLERHRLEQEEKRRIQKEREEMFAE